MGYYASSDPGADNATARHVAYVCHNPGTGDLGLARFLQDTHSRQHYGPSTTTLASTTSSNNNNNNMNDVQRNYIDEDPIIYLRNNHQNRFTHFHQAPSYRPASVPQLSHPILNQNVALPRNIAPLKTPVDAALHKQIERLITGVSLNYLGDPYLPANQSANIPDELNTSVWITNLPANVNHKTLLDNVRNCGKVYAAVINGPEHTHITAASKIVFFDVAGAQNLLDQAREGSFTVGDHIPRVIHNRIKTEAKPPCPNSRVLHIEGPSCIVNQRYLAALFRNDGITWQDEEIIVLSDNGILTRLEWRFGSYRCQAESARHLIDRVKRHCNNIMPLNYSQYWQGVTVHFGVDPCAPTTGKYPLSGLVFVKCWRELTFYQLYHIYLRPTEPKALILRTGVARSVHLSRLSDLAHCILLPRRHISLLVRLALAPFQAQIPEPLLNYSRS
ncbi:hypothetical protein CIB48_g4541 [Xylaria polymorpha]|nr:hypothetical protein CIB48_g4541 [Xylaria polymorpha]